MRISRRIGSRFWEPYAPTNTMNSDQNEFRPGNPRDAKKAIARTAENCGIAFASPWSSGISRVPVLCLTDPASMNRAAQMVVTKSRWSACQ